MRDLAIIGALERFSNWQQEFPEASEALYESVRQAFFQFGTGCREVLLAENGGSTEKMCQILYGMPHTEHRLRIAAAGWTIAMVPPVAGSLHTAGTVRPASPVSTV